MKAILLVLAMLFSASSFSQDVADAAIKGQIKALQAKVDAARARAISQEIAIEKGRAAITAAQLLGESLAYATQHGRGDLYLETFADLQAIVDDPTVPTEAQETAFSAMSKYPPQMILDRLKAIIGGAK